jgi:hypothetical protein
VLVPSLAIPPPIWPARLSAMVVEEMSIGARSL